MKKRMIVAANWKMNKNLSEASEFLEKLDFHLDENISQSSVIIFPPFIGLESLAGKFNSNNFYLGSQNFHYEESGAFTGEVSISMLEHIGIDYAIIGHSERRSLFYENDNLINKKIRSCLASSINPIFCIGESLEQRDSDLTEKKLSDQLKSGLENIDASKLDKLIIAYEPIWAIGTGKTATVDQIYSTHQQIKGILNELFNDESYDLPILYGGSVNDKNAKEIGMIDNVSGFLIGGASLKIETFCEIIDLCNFN